MFVIVVRLCAESDHHARFGGQRRIVLPRETAPRSDSSSPPSATYGMAVNFAAVDSSLTKASLICTHLTLLRCYHQTMPKRMPPEVLEYLRSLGKYGSQGGKTAAKNMTAEERLARAKKASVAAAKKRTTERLARGRASQRGTRTAKRSRIKSSGEVTGV